MKTISIGRKNNIFQYIETLKSNRTKRFSNGEFFVEGVQSINNAITNGWEISHFIYSDYSKLSRWAKEKIDNSCCENWQLSRELMESLSGKTDKSELFAIIKMKSFDLNLTENPLILICDTPSKKGNLGTIIRSADALGCDGLVITGHSVDLYDPDTIAATMGSFFNLPVIKNETNNKIFGLINDLKQKYPKIQIVATILETETYLHEVDFKKPTILLIGNETNGLSKFMLEIANVNCKIDMVGKVDSLNVACAASICLYEIKRQREK